MARSSRIAGGWNWPTDGKLNLSAPPSFDPTLPSPAWGGGTGRGDAEEGREGAQASEITHGSEAGVRNAMWTAWASPQSPRRSAAPSPSDLAIAVQVCASTSKRRHGA